MMKMIAELYHYFFYKLYTWNLKAWGEKEMPTLNALLHLSLLMWFNLLTLVLLVEFLMGISLIDFKSVSIVLATVLSLSVLLINYFGLVYGSRKQNIIDQYSDENDEKKRKGDFVLGWYIGLTVLAFVLSLITKIK